MPVGILNITSTIHMMPVPMARLCWNIDRLMNQYLFGQGMMMHYEYDSHLSNMTITARMTFTLKSFEHSVSLSMRPGMIYPNDAERVAQQIVENLLCKMALAKLEIQ